MMKSSKIDLLIQYAVLIAGQEDEYLDRQLGPIHLIKYVYLADLAYAEREKGEKGDRFIFASPHSSGRSQTAPLTSVVGLK